MVKTDAELVKAARNGQQDLFTELVKRYQRPVWAVALEILGDYHQAADVSQESFIRAFESLETLRKPSSFGPWLLKITRRCAIETGRSRQKEIQAKTVAEVIENPNGRLDEENQWLLAAVVKLPKAEKQVVMLHYFGRNSVGDVAKMLDRSVGTVTKQLSRARIRLRKILERQEK